jgi:hypothetical protein
MTKGASAPWRKWIVPVLLILATAALFFAGYRRRTAAVDKAPLLLELQAVQVPNGWGYLIFMNHHVYIKQNIIPAVPGEHPFRSREDALAVGQKVFDRLKAGQMPIVNAAEVKAMGVVPDTTTKK